MLLAQLGWDVNKFKCIGVESNERACERREVCDSANHIAQMKYRLLNVNGAQLYTIELSLSPSSLFRENLAVSIDSGFITGCMVKIKFVLGIRSSNKI